MVKSALSIIAEHANPDSIFECAMALLELKLGEGNAAFIVIDGRGHMPVVHSSTKDYAHTVGLLSVAIDVVSEDHEQHEDDQSDG